MSEFSFNFLSSAADTIAVFETIQLSMTDNISGDSTQRGSQQELRQVFKNARPVSIETRSNIQYMVHPTETGSNLTDHRIILPREVSLKLILSNGEFHNTYQEIHKLATDSTLLTIQTKSDTFRNMAIDRLPSIETADAIDTVSIELKLREIQFEITSSGVLNNANVANPKDSDTENRGSLLNSNPVTMNLNTLFG